MVKKTTPTNDVTVSRSTLRRFISFVEGLDGADKAYFPCQDTAFRKYAKDALKAQGIQEAIQTAKALLEEE